MAQHAWTDLDQSVMCNANLGTPACDNAVWQFERTGSLVLRPTLHLLELPASLE